MQDYRMVLNISYKDHATNENVLNRFQDAIRSHDDLFIIVKKRTEIGRPCLKTLRKHAYVTYSDF